MYTLKYLKWVTNKNLLHSTGNSAQYYVVAWMGGSEIVNWMVLVGIVLFVCLFVRCLPR